MLCIGYCLNVVRSSIWIRAQSYGALGASVRGDLMVGTAHAAALWPKSQGYLPGYS